MPKVVIEGRLYCVEECDYCGVWYRVCDLKRILKFFGLCCDYICSECEKMPS